MQAVILSGGFGKRLYPLDAVLPKSLVPIEGRPILRRVLEGLSKSGVKNVTLLIGHLGWMVDAFVREHPIQDLDVQIVSEEAPSGNANALLKLSSVADDFLLLNGDVLLDIDYRELLNFHCRSDSDLTIVTVRKSHQLHVGVVHSDDCGRVVKFDEKPILEWNINAGIYAVSKAALQHLSTSSISMDRWILELLKNGRKVLNFESTGNWVHVTTVEDIIQREGVST